MLDRAKTAGVDKIIVTGGTLTESREALALARTSPALFSTCGVHPTRCNEFEAHTGGARAYLDELTAVCEGGQREGKVVAVGECGLDWDRTKFCSREVQRTYFALQFELAERTRLPLFLHNRNTGGEFVEMMERHHGRYAGGVVHSFTGSWEEAEALLGLGLSIGLNGCSLRTEEGLAVARRLPADRLMLETDAPWCGIKRTHPSDAHVRTRWESAKRPERRAAGQCVKDRSEPCHVVQVLEVVAAVRGVSEEDLATAVWENTEAMFFTARPSAE